MRACFALALFAALPCVAGAQDTSSVWVNTSSRVYHCRGSEFYGKTSKGMYTVERDAQAKGFRAAGGKTCDAAIAAAPARSAATLDSGPRRPIRQTSECIVARVIDGDTLECRGGVHVRLLGIDAPERSQRPFGATSTHELTALLPTGSRTLIEQDLDARDKYGRLLAYVWLNGKQVNWMMIRAGWAVVLTYPPNVQYADYLIAAQRRARDEKRGLWNIGGFACSPSDHRQKRC